MFFKIFDKLHFSSRDCCRERERQLNYVPLKLRGLEFRMFIYFFFSIFVQVVYLYKVSHIIESCNIKPIKFL